MLQLNKNVFSEIKESNFPLILVGESSILKNILFSKLDDVLNMQFTIRDFKKKIISGERLKKVKNFYNETE